MYFSLACAPPPRFREFWILARTRARIRLLGLSQWRAPALRSHTTQLPTWRCLPATTLLTLRGCCRMVGGSSLLGGASLSLFLSPRNHRMPPPVRRMSYFLSTLVARSVSWTSGPLFPSLLLDTLFPVVDVLPRTLLSTNHKNSSLPARVSPHDGLLPNADSRARRQEGARFAGTPKRLFSVRNAAARLCCDSRARANFERAYSTLSTRTYPWSSRSYSPCRHLNARFCNGLAGETNKIQPDNIILGRLPVVAVRQGEGRRERKRYTTLQMLAGDYFKENGKFNRDEIHSWSNQQNKILLDQRNTASSFPSWTQYAGNSQVPQNHPLNRLTAWIDSEGIIKLGGRFYKTQLEYHSTSSYITTVQSTFTVHSEFPHSNISRWIQESSLCTHQAGNLDYLKQSSWHVTYSRLCDLCKVSDSASHGGNYPWRWTIPSPPFTHTRIN